MLRRSFKFLFQRHRKKSLFILAALLLGYWFCLPKPLFRTPTCMVLEDSKGDLLGARIAADGQWRFPHQMEVPEKFKQAILEFEDRRFYRHPGVDPVGLARAIEQNIRNGEIVSGGSTISMQVIRLSRPGKSRSVWQKLLEVIMATRLEIRYSKSEILALYASNAPFGGNVVGLDAASWRYFGKRPELLSWGEAALLAVLPNSPGLIHPGRNRSALLAKRNRLLDRLQAAGKIDAMTCELAKAEPLPEKPRPLPRLAPHLLDRAYLDHFKGKPQQSRLRTTIDRQLQKRLNQVLEQHHYALRENQIHNLAALIVEVESGNIVAYAGNVKAGAAHGDQVDVIRASRSTGSILKPFLYAMMLNEGHILPNSLVSDIPTHLSGYRPQNFHDSYAGVIPASQAVSRSLNVPLIRMLSNFGLEKFHLGLQQLGLTTINRPARHYGLPLVLGGAEGSLEEITNAYVGMSRTLGHFYPYNGQYAANDFRPLNYEYGQQDTIVHREHLINEAPILSAAAIWQTFEAMRKVERPSSEGDWQQFGSSQNIAWKTGTSFGFRDAWAVGVNQRYAVGVWAGNADGEGRPGLVGVVAAAPVLFDLFNLLESASWFDQPYDEMVLTPVCKQSGYRALEYCEVDSLWIAQSGFNAPACQYHRRVFLSQDGQWQVNRDCAEANDIITANRFVLPPVEAHFYQTQHPNYNPLPPYRSDCQNHQLASQPMQMIYPNRNTKIYVPIGLNGELSKTVFKVAHQNPTQIIHWHLDQEYLGSTQHFHHLELQPQAGKHQLTLVDEDGNRLSQRFEILQR